MPGKPARFGAGAAPRNRFVTSLADLRDRHHGAGKYFRPVSLSGGDAGGFHGQRGGNEKFRWRETRLQAGAW
jgi:hypothetical protein